MFDEEQKPELLSAKNFALALLVHFALFALIFLCSLPLRSKETVIPIDLTVVVHENLDGNEDEPPPLEKPEPPPPKPEARPKPVVPEVPKVEEKIEAVEKLPEKKKKPEKKKPEKKPEEKKVETPKKPEKTKQELAEERKRKMLESAKVKKYVPPTNGKTTKKTLSDKDIQKLLNQGYRPGKSEQLAADEVQRCTALIYRAYYDRWNRPAWSSSLKKMELEVKLGPGGRILASRLVSRSGDRAADQSVLDAAARVKSIAGLSARFLSENPVVTVRFEVTPQ